MRNRDWLDSPWDDFFKMRDPLSVPDTGMDEAVVQKVGLAMAQSPADFAVHGGLKRTIKSAAPRTGRA